MNARKAWIKALAVVGTALVIVPIAAAIASAIPLLTNPAATFDWLTPAEFSPVALVGGVMLLGCAMLTKELLTRDLFHPPTNER